MPVQAVQEHCQTTVLFLVVLVFQNLIMASMDPRRAILGQPSPLGPIGTSRYVYLLMDHIDFAYWVHYIILSQLKGRQSRACYGFMSMAQIPVPVI